MDFIRDGIARHMQMTNQVLSMLVNGQSVVNPPDNAMNTGVSESSTSKAESKMVDIANNDTGDSNDDMAVTKALNAPAAASTNRESSLVCRRFDILIVGDSLSAGYSPDGEHDYQLSNDTLSVPYDQCHFPFQHRMLSQLRPTANATSFHADNVAYDGAQATSAEMKSLFAKQKLGRYDIVIIFAGINDLGWGSIPQQVMAALAAYYSAVKAAGKGRVLAVTIPESRLDSAIILRARRLELNQLIRESGVDYLDLSELFPYQSLSLEDKKKLFDSDKLHFTAAGSDRIGELFAERINQMLL